MNLHKISLALTLVLASSLAWAQPHHKVIIDQDCAGPGGSNLQTLLMMIQSPQVGAGNHGGDRRCVARRRGGRRALRLHDRRPYRHPRRAGGGLPLVHRREEAELRQQRSGKVAYAGAWDARWWHEPFAVPRLPEGQPTTKPANEDAAHFLIRMVHQYPHEVTIYEGGPMTDLALAIAIDPQFPELAKEHDFMGGSLSPQTDYPELPTIRATSSISGLIRRRRRSYSGRRGRKSSAHQLTYRSRFGLRPS